MARRCAEPRYTIPLPFVANFFLLCLSACLRRVVSRCICLSIHLTLSFHISSCVSVNLCVLTYMYFTHKREHLEYAHISNVNLRESRQEANRVFCFWCEAYRTADTYLLQSSCMRHTLNRQCTCAHVCVVPRQVSWICLRHGYTLLICAQTSNTSGGAGQNGGGEEKEGT